MCQGQRPTCRRDAPPMLKPMSSSSSSTSSGHRTRFFRLDGTCGRADMTQDFLRVAIVCLTSTAGMPICIAQNKGYASAWK